jgi:hypothetical protein
VTAIHDHRPVLVWGRPVVVVARPLAAPDVRRRREQQVLAKHPFLRVFPRGGEPGDLGEVALAVVVVTGQMAGEFIDPPGLLRHSAIPSLSKPGHKCSWLIGFVFRWIRWIRQVLRYFSEIYLGIHEGGLEGRGHAELGLSFGVPL